MLDLVLWIMSLWFAVSIIVALYLVSPRYLLLCAACLIGYQAPSVIDLPTTGAWWFVELSSWSMAILIVSMLANCGRTSVLIATLESAAILLNLVCLWQYMTVKGYIYSIYGGVIDAIVIAEIIILIVGAPWDGIRRMVHERWGSPNNLDPVYMRSRLDNQAGEAR